MKTKKATKTNAKSRIIFFAIVLTYNLLLGLYLKDFFVLSPMLMTLYLLSALPTLFFVLKIRSTPMRAIVYILLIFVLGMSAVSFVCCRRFLTIMTMLEMVVMLMHLALSNNNSGKDKLQTKIYVLTVSVLIVVTLLFSYNFVFKPEVPYLNNGGATLWDTQTEELADEICSDCDTDEEKVKAIYEWMIHNFEYDYGYTPMVQYFNVHQTIETRKGICYDFSHLFAALCRSQNIPCYVVDGDKRNNAQYHHTWNRVYFDGSWWNIDVTFDIVQTKKQEQLYWFRKIINPYAQDKEYQITKIY